MVRGLGVGCHADHGWNPSCRRCRSQPAVATAAATVTAATVALSHLSRRGAVVAAATVALSLSRRGAAVAAATVALSLWPHAPRRRRRYRRRGRRPQRPAASAAPSPTQPPQPLPRAAANSAAHSPPWHPAPPLVCAPCTAPLHHTPKRHCTARPARVRCATALGAQTHQAIR